jgi:hypothetical protein
MYELIRKQDPLKQGLKLDFVLNTIITAYDSQARSIKTRIETQKISRSWIVHPNSRARSIKTRIETVRSIIGSWFIGSIREQDPLKQGLKLV